ncbi:MAG: DUF2834 domain-containing protein [Patescibacteria group bacterium]
MKAKHIYLTLAVIGIILPYSQYVPFYQLYGNDVGKFFTDLFANYSIRFILMDMVVTAIAFFVLIAHENRTRKVKHAWIAILGVFMVGVSFGFPLYLYLRERAE